MPFWKRIFHHFKTIAKTFPFKGYWGGRFFLFLGNDTNMGEIRIKNIPTGTHQDIKAIAKNLGVDVGQFLKVKLKEISDSYSKEMKDIDKNTKV